MTAVSLESYSSYVREVDGECVFVRVSNNFLFAGSRSGEVACWDISRGVELWRLNFEGPCSDSDYDDEIFFLTESDNICLLYTSPSPRDLSTSRMPSSA